MRWSRNKVRENQVMSRYRSADQYRNIKEINKSFINLSKLKYAYFGSTLTTQINHDKISSECQSHRVISKT
jgi:hypothetical protein